MAVPTPPLTPLGFAESTLSPEGEGTGKGARRDIDPTDVTAKPGRPKGRPLFDNPYRSRYVARMPALDPLTRQSIDLFLARVRPRYAIVEAWLYGSRATGAAREDSDVDLALVIEGETRPASSVAAEMGGDGFDVLMETGRFVSPLAIRAEQWRDPDSHSNPYLLASVRRDGIAV